LSIARIESKTMQLNKTNFDLNLKIENVIGDISQQVSSEKRDKLE
jgi:hypothetical protein